MTEIITEFYCKICKKYYSSYQSLWIHNKKFHTNILQHNNNIPQHNNNILQHNNHIQHHNSNLIESNFICKYCSKIYKHQQSKSRHEKICTQKNKTITDNTIDKKFEDFKNTILDIIQKEAKIHPKTLQKINKQLINNNSNTINNGIINNGPVINNTYVKFGNEQLSSLLTRKDMLNIINKQCLCIEESIKKVHFNNKLPEYMYSGKITLIHFILLE
jgi:hypothetical protein